MKIITSNGTSMIAMQLRSTLATINEDVKELPEKLSGDLMPAGILPTGPMMFLYQGVNQDPHNEFDLRIGLPVSSDDAARYKGPYLSFRLEPFQFVETVLYGDLAELGPKAYEPLFAEIEKQGLTMTGFSREVYQNFVDAASPDNETRVQIGVVGV